MKPIIIYDRTEGQVKRSITIRKLCVSILALIFLLISPIIFVLMVIRDFISRTYNYLYPKRERINKVTSRLIIVYTIATIIINIITYLYNKSYNSDFLFLIPILIVSFVIIKYILKLYHFLFGEYQLLNNTYSYTREYVNIKLPKLLKVFGETGAGKDTFVAGCCSMLAEEYKNQTENDINKIRSLLFCINFELLDYDLNINYKIFLTNNKERIEKNYMKLANERKQYLKSYYINNKKLKPKAFLEDYENFKKDPYNFATDYAVGVRVNRKHFIQVILEEYIQWYIRINFEKNFLMVNQPFIEDPQSGLMAKKFSLRFLKLKRIDKESYDKTTRKKTITKENVFFPWRDRLIVAETECGSWYMNRDKAADAEMLKSGIRDFKAYSRHFVKDFRWFQVDQAPERTSKLFRELDHSYVAVLNRMTVSGGKKRNIILNIFVWYYNLRIRIIEHRCNKSQRKRDKAEIRINDAKELYYASSKEKYKMQYQRLEKKYQVKKLPPRHEKFTYKKALLLQRIDLNEKDGFIIETVCVSKNPNSPIEFTITPVRDIINSDKRHLSFVTNLVFKMSDCERYDTRYMKNLADSKSKETKINYNDVPTWKPNFKMDQQDVIWMGYLSAKEQYGIKDEDMENMNYNEAYKDHINSSQLEK